MSSHPVTKKAALTHTYRGAERRAAIRYPSNAQTTCQPVGRRNDTWPAHIRDVSTHGIGLVLSRRFEKGTLLTLFMKDEISGEPVMYMTRVVHATQQPSGQWVIGCAFATELDDDDLEVFQAQRQKPESPEDGRAWVRFPCKFHTICHAVPPAPAADWAAVVCDIAPGGLGVLVAHEFPCGTFLNVEFAGPIGEPARLILVRIVRPGNPTNGGWLHGCEFARQLTDEEREALQF